MRGLDDTIAAIATAPGAAGLAVVRVSGAEALRIADLVFRGTKPLAQSKSHTLHHGWAVWPRSETEWGDNPVRFAGVAAACGGSGAADSTPSPRRLDEVMVAIFRAPASYTREHVVEISCHGGRLPAERVLAALLGAGARLARPGEFTLRAFLNGRVDLAQAEAVADVIHAETEAAHELALSHLAGELSRRLEELAERITDALSQVEARVDFAEDVGGIEVPAQAIEAIARTDAELGHMLKGSSYARAVREGVRVPLVGRPNVGKSSLFNALLGEERAIVTAVPGTTRDRVSEAVELAGIRVTLSDTAGLHHGADPVEAIGIERARQVLVESRAVLWVVDGSLPLDVEDHWIAGQLVGRRVLVALNKRDLGQRVSESEVEALLEHASARHMVGISATRGDGLDELRRGLAALLGADRAPARLGAAVANARHTEALSRARGALRRAATAGRAAEPGEIVALELRECLSAIGEVTGRTVGEDLLDRIFSRFCIGK